MPAWFFSSLQGYRIEWLPRDLVAGLMLAAIAIPGQLATARLAGMPPETGLYAFAAGSLAFAAFGANRFMSVAADSTIAPIFAGGLSSIAAIGTAHYTDLATLLAIMVGIVLVTVGLLLPGVLVGLGVPTPEGTLVAAWYLGLTAVTLACAYAGRGLNRTHGVVIIGGYLAFVAAVLITSR